MVTKKFEQTAAAARSVWREEVHRSPSKRLGVKLALKKSGDIALELIKKYSTKSRQKEKGPKEKSAAGCSKSDAKVSFAEVNRRRSTTTTSVAPEVEYQAEQIDSSFHQRIRLMAHHELNPRRQRILQEIYQTEFNWYSVRDEDEEACAALLKLPPTPEAEGRR